MNECCATLHVHVYLCKCVCRNLWRLSKEQMFQKVSKKALSSGRSGIVGVWIAVVD